MLTDERIAELLRSHLSLWTVARAVEAEALKEKE